MRALTVRPGEEEALEVREESAPVPADGELLEAFHATTT